MPKSSAVEAAHPVMCERKDQKPHQQYSVLITVHHRRKLRVIYMFTSLPAFSVSYEKTSQTLRNLHRKRNAASKNAPELAIAAEAESCLTKNQDEQ